DRSAAMVEFGFASGAEAESGGATTVGRIARGCRRVTLSADAGGWVYRVAVFSQSGDVRQSGWTDLALPGRSHSFAAIRYRTCGLARGDRGCQGKRVAVHGQPDALRGG